MDNTTHGLSLGSEKTVRKVEIELEFTKISQTVSFTPLNAKYMRKSCSSKKLVYNPFIANECNQMKVFAFVVYMHPVTKTKEEKYLTCPFSTFQIPRDTWKYLGNIIGRYTFAQMQIRK